LVLGGADSIFAFSMLGHAEAGIVRSVMTAWFNDRQFDDVSRWMQRFYQDVQASVGYTNGPVVHLWHGTKQNRQYGSRQAILKESGFDPLSDIAIDQNGCWQWNSQKTELHRKVAEYFQSRKETEVLPDRGSSEAAVFRGSC
jgi:hypothetical protein